MSIAPFGRGNRVKLENPMQRIYGGVIVSGERFVREVFSTLKGGDLDLNDIYHW